MKPTYGVTLGHIFGIRIALDVSVLFIALLLTMSLGSGVFPSWHPSWPPYLSFLLGLAATVLFLLSILAHELAHALVAKAYAIPVSSITLFVFGGVASIERDPETPSAEALIAIVGPVMSIAIGVACLATAGILLPTGSEDPVSMLTSAGPFATLLLWLGPVNVVLALFNLLPGLPLDGGRVLRAGLWKASGDLERSTRGAALAGHALGWILILAGAAMALGVEVPALGRGLLPGLWTALVGWFLKSAAAASYEDVVIRRALERLPVGRVMRQDLPPRIDARESVDVMFEEVLVKRGARLVAVELEGEAYGVIEARQVREVPRDQWHLTHVDRLARPLSQFPTACPSDGVYETMQRMLRERLDTLLVCEGGRIAGQVSLADVNRWLELHGPRPAPIRRFRSALDEPS